MTIILLASPIQTSNGNNQEDYRECLMRCREAEGCSKRFFPLGQSLVNKIFLWDCTSECQYNCMWITEANNLQKKLPTVQYYGKWPFLRLFGMQEPASAILSIGNLGAHLYGYYYIYKEGLEGKASNWFLHEALKLNFVISVNAWLWSSVFHSRDLWWTMWLDYFSAIALLFVGVGFAICRTIRIRDHRRQVFIFFLLALYYTRHLYGMIFVNFNFGWNMKVAMFAALTITFLYIFWSCIHLIAGKRSHSKYALSACLLGLAAASFELFDFSPIGYILDAHACWHAATIPIILLWYIFYRDDARYDLGLTYTRKQTFE